MCVCVILLYFANAQMVAYERRSETMPKQMATQWQAALTREKHEQKNLPICGDLCDNKSGQAIIFSHKAPKREVFHK